MQLNEEQLTLIARHFKGETSREEESKLSEWLKESDQNKRAYEELKFLWAAGKKSVQEVPDVDLAWNKVREKARLGNVTDSASGGMVRSLFNSYFLKVAASLVIVLTAAYLINKQVGKDELIQVVSGEDKTEFMLPDGSKIYLNRNSSLSYSGKKFNDDQREVFLEGEAFFEVKKDSRRPFIVQGNLSVTRVLGTSFNVKSIDSEGADVLQVVTGKVSFASKDKKVNQEILLPGDKASIVSGGRVEKEKVINNNFLAWKSGELKFENSSLEEVAETAENYFDIDIEIADSSLTDCRFTGSFVKPAPEELMKVLSVSMNLSWQKSDSAYVLSGEGCN